MKKLFLPLLLLALSLSSCSKNDGKGGEEEQVPTLSKYVSRVLEFAPAPGQFTNKLPPFSEGDSEQAMLKKVENLLVGKTGNVVSLGAYGGYIVVGFDHSIVNAPNAKDFKVYGNAFDTSAEPGIVMVSADENGNNLPDDEWYELAGSEYARATKNYSISYLRPTLLNGNVKWFDNQGKHDTLYVVSSYTGDSYFPLWTDKDTLTFYGTLLPNNSTTTDSIIWQLPAYEWGYADNKSNNSDGCTFDIDWAVDRQGNKKALDKIDFIKIYTGVNQATGWVGETSTEVGGVEDLN